MSLSGYISKLKKEYVINKTNNTKLPCFISSPVARYYIVFTGLVQRVGFRLEVATLSERLSLTGWIKNREDKSVEAEIQGEKEKIIFLINNMKSLKRAIVKEVKMTEITVIEQEKSFLIAK